MFHFLPLNVAAVGSQEDVDDVVPIELGDAAPAVAAYGSPLQLPVVGWIDAVDETAYFYCLCHIDGFFQSNKNTNFPEMQQNNIDTFCRKFKKRRKPLAGPAPVGSGKFGIAEVESEKWTKE